LSNTRLVNPSMTVLTVRFWSGWGRTFGTNIQTRGRTIGFSAMTTPTHTSLVVQQFMTSRNIAVIPHPIRLASPPVTISYSPRWNYVWRGVALTCWIARGYRYTFENFQRCMKSMETHWDCCIHAQGDHFEGNGNWELR
jgi:hypothetical protein